MLTRHDYYVTSLRNTARNQGSAITSNNVVTTAINIATTQTITGIWANYTANRFIEKPFTGMAIICDTNGNVLARGSSVSFTVPQEQETKHWYFFPLDTPFIATANINYWFGTQRTGGYDDAEFTHLSVSSESFNLYDYTTNVQISVPSKIGLCSSDDQTNVSSWTTDNAYGQAIGIQVEEPDTTPPSGYANDATTRYLNAVTKASVNFSVHAYDNESGLSSVKFATWGDSGGQNDIVWYDGEDLWQTEVDWDCTINFNNHDGGIDQHYNVHVYAYNNAGYNTMVAAYDIYVDTVAPVAPTQTNGILYATSNGVSWTAFSDGANSSGLLLTTMNFQIWNGSEWVNMATYPKSVAGLTHSFTGLTPNTLYRWGVTYTDNSSNVSTLNYTTFITNALATSTIHNLTSNGYLFDPTPKIKFSGSDINGGTFTNFEVQFATDSAFTLNVESVTSSASPSQFSATSASSGTLLYHTPTTVRASGVWYVRSRVFDGIEWGTWSATITFTIQAISWPTTIADADTAISKRTIDDIRVKVNAVRQARGMAVVTWTDPTITDWNSGTPTQVRTTHLIELRQAIVDIYIPLAITSPTWTDNIISTTVSKKGIHWIELRNALINC